MGRKVTAQSVQIARRAKIGQKLELTADDVAAQQKREQEQAARLERIAARQRQQ